MEHSENDNRRWVSGDHVIFRQIWAGKVWAAIPVTIVEDSAQLVSVYVRPGTEFAAPLCSRGEYLNVMAGREWSLQLLPWYGHHLWTSVPGTPYSIWSLWSESNWKHQGWKINPELPLKRTSIGFDTTDHVIDAIIQRDLSRWDWKDEDEFAKAIELGLISSDDAIRIRQVTVQVANDALSQQGDRLHALANWRPPSNWTNPILAGNWRVL